MPRRRKQRFGAQGSDAEDGLADFERAPLRGDGGGAHVSAAGRLPVKRSDGVLVRNVAFGHLWGYLWKQNFSRWCSPFSRQSSRSALFPWNHPRRAAESL